ncbi:MAG: LytS/YhcK type 5TM receptor domain-containing protein, partial [Bacteroidales bacterium]|nr:LytS/YhcK type 5TM receptor domain-containing protein [Bacteroidales bacterium]
MTGSIALSLIQNTAILLSFAMLYDYFWVREEESRHLFAKILAGLAVGGIGLVLMLTPWILVPGLVFDTRTILLSVSGLFLGAIPTIIAIVLLGLVRIFMGGDGMWMGLAVIVTSGIIGILWGQLRPSWRNKNYLGELLAVGLLVHLVMLACTLFLPNEHIMNTLKVIVLPVFFIYWPGTILLGVLLLSRVTSWKNKKALFETQALYVSLVEHMPAGVFRKSRDGRYDYVNARYCKLKGLTEKEILGKTPDELAHYEETKVLSGESGYFPGQRTLATSGMEHHEWILRTGNSIDVEEEYPQKDGSIDYFQVVKTPIFDINGQVVGSQGMQFDITLQKQLQSELIIAKEKAEENDRLKTAFLHNISHEIRTPMNSIIGFSDLFKESELPIEKRIHYADVIIQSSRQLLSIIDDIVRISTIEAGQEKICEADVQINSLL